MENLETSFYLGKFSDRVIEMSKEKNLKGIRHIKKLKKKFGIKESLEFNRDIIIARYIQAKLEMIYLSEELAYEITKNKLFKQQVAKYTGIVEKFQSKKKPRHEIPVIDSSETPIPTSETPTLGSSDTLISAIDSLPENLTPNLNSLSESIMTDEFEFNPYHFEL